MTNIDKYEINHTYRPVHLTPLGLFTTKNLLISDGFSDRIFPSLFRDGFTTETPSLNFSDKFVTEIL